METSLRKAIAFQMVADELDNMLDTGAMAVSETAEGITNQIPTDEDVDQILELMKVTVHQLRSHFEEILTQETEGGHE